MRIKFLSVIVSFFLVSFAVTSCLDTEEIEYSPDATIHAFALDTIHGVNYKFTIDQLGPDGVGLIYNQDSLPVGSDTIIDRILIKTLTTTSGIITAKNAEGQDTLFNYSDSIDFRGTMQKPMRIKVWAADMQYTKEYTISVRVHQQDPDSMNWTKMTDNFANYSGYQKSVTLNEDLLIYTSNTTAYKSSGDVISKGRSWTPVSITGLPDNIKLSSIISFGGKLYATNGESAYVSSDGALWNVATDLNKNGKVEMLIAPFPKNEGNLLGISGIAGIINNGESAYVSSDGALWNVATDLNKNGKVEMLIAPFPKNEGNLLGISGIAGIINNGDQSTFAITNPEATAWNIGSETVGADFPLENLSATSYLTATGIQTIAVMGNNRNANDTTSIAWTSQDGLLWIPLKTSSSTAYCPKLDNPSFFYYDNAFLAFGGNFETIYTSEAGIAWYKANKKIFLPAEFKDRENNYSTVVDKNNFIWVIWSNGGANEVWRGRINKFGFKRQNNN